MAENQIKAEKIISSRYQIEGTDFGFRFTFVVKFPETFEEIFKFGDKMVEHQKKFTEMVEEYTAKRFFEIGVKLGI